MREVSKEIVKQNFKNDYGLPFELTDGQADIFAAIYFKLNSLVQIITPTQYGKSDVVAMATVCRSIAYREKFAIVSGSEKQASIIMGKVIQHTFDNDDFKLQLLLDAGEKLDKIRKTRSKENIDWKNGGGVRIYTANAKTKKAVTTSLTGFGAPNVICDESSLIDDDLEAMVARMVGGHVHNSWLYLKIGNPFNRNHFLVSWMSDKWIHIFIDYKQALAEGRYTEDFIEMMRTKPFFDVLYECKFPPEKAMIDGGWRRLMTSDEIKYAMREDPNPLKGTPILGIDVGEGGDATVAIMRWNNKAKKVGEWNVDDPLTLIPEIVDIMDQYGCIHAIGDAIGIGNGFCRRLHEVLNETRRIKAGKKRGSCQGWKTSYSAEDDEVYVNSRAELHFKAKDWLVNQDGTLDNLDIWLDELGHAFYKQTSSQVIQIMSKEEMRDKHSWASPNHADALYLTFAPASLGTSDDFFMG